MAEVNPPWTLENLGTHHANANRMLMAAITAGGEGVVPTLGLGTMAVTQRGAGANMSVDVAPGICVVFGDENSVQGVYGCTNDAAKNVTIAAADPSNARRDLIVVRVRDAFYSGASNAWDLFAVTGTPSGSPADPAVPSNAVVLARVAVAAAAASITNANITDLRCYTGLGIMPVNSARAPGVVYGPYSQAPAFKPVPIAGLPIFETDTFSLKQYTTPTTGFRLPWALPWGRLASAASNGVAPIASGTGGVETVAAISAAVTLPANRRIRVTGYVRLSGSSAFYGKTRIRRGTTTGGTLLGGPTEIGSTNDGFGAACTPIAIAEDTGYTPGSVQYTVTGEGGDLTNPCVLLVDDVGPAANPA